MKQIRAKITSIIMIFFLVAGMIPALSKPVYAKEGDRTESLITVEMGAGHEEAAKKFAGYLNDAGNGFTDCEAKLNGTAVTFYYTRSIIENYFEYDSANEELTARTAYAQSATDQIRWDALPDAQKEAYNYIENGEMLSNLLARNPIEYYMNGEDDKIEGEADFETDATLLPKEQTFYAQWMKPISECSITVEPPVCGEENSGDFYKNTNPPKVTVNGEHYKVSAGADYYSAYWLKKGADDSYENEIFEGRFEGGKVYGAEIGLESEYGYYFPKDIKCTVEGADLQAVNVLRPAASGQPNPSTSGLFIGLDLNVTAVHDWSEWTTVKEPTYQEEGLEERVCSGDSSHKETRPIEKLYSVGIELDTDLIEWTAEEGYKGATDDGIESDALHKKIQVTSTGNDKVDFVVAGFKDMSSYEQFSVSAGGMEVTVAPKEGLAPGIYTCTVIIGDSDERFDDVEIPVRFTVTAKDVKSSGDKYSDTKGNDTAAGNKNDTALVINGNGYQQAANNSSMAALVSKAAAPKTGDESNILLWLTAAAAASAALVVAVAAVRKIRAGK